MARVLIVDDDEILVRLIGEYMRLVEHEAHAAASLAEAKRALNGQHWDVVLADRLLPDGDGATLGDVCPPTTAFLTMTGADRDELAADLYKPFSLAELGAAIHRKREGR